MSQGFDSIPNTDGITEFIGAISLFITAATFVPQIIKFYSKKNNNSLSKISVLAQCFCYLVYITYGVLVHDWIYILNSAMSFMFNLVIIRKILYYKKYGMVIEGIPGRAPVPDGEMPNVLPDILPHELQIAMQGAIQEAPVYVPDEFDQV